MRTYDEQAPGKGRLLIYAMPVGEGRIEWCVRFLNSATETFDVGHDTEYKVPFAFSGTLKKMVFEYVK
jgi:hypothetical protein